MSQSGDTTISLPNGGGALQGVGETFAPDLFTGTGNFSVPVSLPAGRNGYQPELNFVYSTGNGNGPFGLGWNLSIPGVSRKTSKGVPVYEDESDTFILSGSEDLVAVSHPGPGNTQYRPRTEGLFAKIFHHRNTQSNYWEVQSKDGLTSFYGEEHAAGNDNSVVADPADRTKAFAWKLRRTVDPFGNTIEYEYERDTEVDGPHHWDQLYLKRIRYADYKDVNDATKFLVSVTFHYEDRPDPYSDYRAGFEIRTRRRCTHIDVRTDADKERLVRTYKLIYLDQRAAIGEVADTMLPLNGVSLLSQIKVVGHDGEQHEEADRIDELPSLEFAHTRFEPENRDFFPLEGSDVPARSLADPDLELVDLFGNGMPDVLEMNGGVRYWRNAGGRFELPRPMQTAPAGLRLADSGVQLVDADGDGRTDLLVTTETLSGYFPLRFGGLWDRKSFRRYRAAPSFDLEDPEVRLVDLNGDGVTDAIRSGSRFECFFSDPDEGWKDTRRVERQAIEEFPNVNFSDPRVKWADMTGDGLQDVLLVYDGNIEYWPNLGNGDWGKRISMRNGPRFPSGYDPRRILVGDVDGDGLADIVYVDHCKVTLWINQSGNGWSEEEIEIDGTPSVSNMNDVRLVDMLGTGVAGVLWSKNTDAAGRDNYFFLDFTGGVKPYLLNEMDNHMGAVTRVEYKPSTWYYGEDEKHPDTRWKTPLPFPVQVVACVEVIDEISRGKLTTEYSYHHGYWDGAEREFRGFGRVDQRDTEEFETYAGLGLHPNRTFEPVVNERFSPPLETRTWFHLGPVGDEFGEWEECDFKQEFWQEDQILLERPGQTTQLLKSLPRRARRDALRTLRGSILRSELYAFDGTNRQDRPYTVTESVFGLREENPPQNSGDRMRIFFPHLLGQRTSQWERGNDPMTQFGFPNDYDDYGQPRTQTQIACPRGWRTLQDAPVEPYLATRTKLQHAQPIAQAFIHDRVAKTTTYEITNNGGQNLLAIRNTPDDSALLEIIGQTLNFYDGPAFQGLPFGQVGDFGALVRSETLILTEDILHEAYRSENAPAETTEKPPYLVPDAATVWTSEYPQGFRDRVPALAGYTFRDGTTDADYERGYFSTTVRHEYDFHQNPASARGLLKLSRDPLGSDTTITYDTPFELLPTDVTDAVGLATKASYDYRVLQPQQVTDPNGNRTHFTFTTLGLLESTAVMGKFGESVGDTPEEPSTRFHYDFLAFENSLPTSRLPISIRTFRREHHVNDTDAPLPQRDDTIETVEYSDGFGRLLQTRTQAEDVIFDESSLPADQSVRPGAAVGNQRPVNAPPNVVVSGWQTYDNKGRVVEKYEPFFATGWEYKPATNGQLAQKVTMFYDPRGQVIRTVNPDDSEQRVIYGVPVDLANPDNFEPTPWEVYTYDENDNAGRTHPVESASYQRHWNTPANALIDALGRTVVSVERNVEWANGNWASVVSEYETKSTYDVRSNLLKVVDPLGRDAFEYVYDLTPANDEEEEEGANVLRIQQLDAGLRRIVFDVVGNEIERRDSKGALTLQNHDLLNRPTRLWARDDPVSDTTLRERLEYGDGGDPNQLQGDRQVNRAANRLGTLHRHYDEAGLLTFHSYDFKDNVLEKERQVISDAEILSVFNPPPPNWDVPTYRVNWQPASGVALGIHAGQMLDPTAYRTSIRYDALNRVKSMRYPEDVESNRKTLQPQYNRAGALQSVTLDGNTYVDHIAYNAKGQRTFIAYGNDVMTRHAYDPKTFRLARMFTQKYTTPQPDSFHYQPRSLNTASARKNNLFQDFAYEYDLAGNILTIKDRNPNSGIPNSVQGTDALDRKFLYDPLNRLVSATGRECKSPPPTRPWQDAPKCQDVNDTRNYRQRYTYDPVGNMLELHHFAPLQQGSFIRQFTLAQGANRLQTLAVDGNTHAYAYDDNGNMTKENTERHFEWDHSDRMRAFRNQLGSSQPSVHAHYLYDSDGQRVKKLVRKQNGRVEVTTYIDDIFEHRRVESVSSTKENNSLHVKDDAQRIAIVRVGQPLENNDQSPTIQYQVGDHLGSSNVVINESGTWTNREEYHPYGEASFGRFAYKRYRFTGQFRP